MATVAEPRIKPSQGESRFLLHDIDWGGYQTLLTMLEGRGVRITYDRGNVELMSPLSIHEWYKKLLGYAVEAISDELEIPRVAAGSTTFHAEALARGLEPDECYYLANAARVRGMERIDLTVDPPPDLAIEVEITSGLLDKLVVYAAHGVPEVWRFDGETLTALLLQPDGTYRESPTSLALPFVPLAEVLRFQFDHDPRNDTRWGRAVRAWVRDELILRYQPPDPGDEPR